MDPIKQLARPNIFGSLGAPDRYLPLPPNMGLDYIQQPAPAPPHTSSRPVTDPDASGTSRRPGSPLAALQIPSASNLPNKEQQVPAPAFNLPDPVTASKDFVPLEAPSSIGPSSKIPKSWGPSPDNSRPPVSGPPFELPGPITDAAIERLASAWAPGARHMGQQVPAPSTTSTRAVNDFETPIFPIRAQSPSVQAAASDTLQTTSQKIPTRSNDAVTSSAPNVRETQQPTASVSDNDSARHTSSAQWTEQEDWQLMDLAAKLKVRRGHHVGNIDFEALAYLIRPRSVDECTTRYEYLIKDTASTRPASWTAPEDRQLLVLAEQLRLSQGLDMGHIDFTDVARIVGPHSQHDCMARHEQLRNAHFSAYYRSPTPWMLEEDKRLLLLSERYRLDVGTKRGLISFGEIAPILNRGVGPATNI